MIRRRIWLALVVTAVLPRLAGSQEVDVREKFNTPTLEAAKEIARSFELQDAKNPKEALAALEAAIKHDARCQLINAQTTTHTGGSSPTRHRCRRRRMGRGLPRGGLPAGAPCQARRHLPPTLAVVQAQKRASTGPGNPSEGRRMRLIEATENPHLVGPLIVDYEHLAAKVLHAIDHWQPEHGYRKQ